MLYSTTGFNPRQIHHSRPGLVACSKCSPRSSLRRFRVSAALVQASEMAAFRCSWASPGDSNPAWLTPAVTPHPNVELIKRAVWGPLYTESIAEAGRTTGGRFRTNLCQF